MDSLETQTINCPKFSFKGLSFPGKCVRVVDGDTVYIVAETLYGYKKFNCRILHIDTPEMRKHGLLAQMAKEETENFALDKTCIIECGDFDNFGRLLVDLKVNGKDLGEHLVNEKLAVYYEGKKKISFDELFEYHGLNITFN